MPHLIATGALPTRRVRLLASLLLATATVAALAALPTASAGAAGRRSGQRASHRTGRRSCSARRPSESLPTGGLTETLSGLPALEGVEPGALEKAVKEVVELLKAKGGNLEELLKAAKARRC